MNLSDLRFLVIAGKGGVGRTTVCAALALVLSRRGRRVLVCQSKSRERLSSLFGVPPIGTELVRVRERLFAVNMTPQAALREYGTMVLRSEFISRQVLENKVSRAFLRAIPGVEDYSMLGKAWYHTTEEESAGEPRWDLVLFDGPATGHIVTMLRLPRAIIEAVPEGPLTRTARALDELLRDPRRAQMVVVTLAEDLPTNEAIELVQRVQQGVGLHAGPLVVNALYPTRFTHGPSARALEALPEDCQDPTLQPLLRSARTAARRRALNDLYLERLRQALPLPQLHLPYLFAGEMGPDAVEELANRLEAQLDGLEGARASAP